MSEPIYIADYDAVIREVLDSGGEFRLYPRGTSMLPLLRQGTDSVALKKLSRFPEKYDVLFYQRTDGSYVLHRVKEVTPQGLTLWGDNQHILEHGVQESQVIGYAARIFRGEKELNTQGVAYRAYLWLWQFWILRRAVLPVVYRIRRIQGYAENRGHPI